MSHLDPQLQALEVRALALLEAAEQLLTVDEAQALQMAELALLAAREEVSTRAFAQAHHLIGQIQVRRGDGEQAARFLETALEVFLALGDGDAEVRVRRDLGAALLDQGRFREAEEHLMQALGRTGGETRGNTLNSLAGLYHATGRYEESLNSLQAARIAFRQADDVAGEVKVLGNLGNLLTSLGRYPEALEHLTAAYNLSAGSAQTLLAAHRSRGAILLSLGALHLDMRDPEEAQRHFQEALAFSRQTGDQVIAANAMLNLAEVQQEVGETQAARSSYEQALQLAQEGQYRQVEASALMGLGQLALAGGQWVEAEAAYRRAGEIAWETGDLEGQLYALLHLGEVQEQLQALPEALGTLELALTLARQVGRPKAVCDVHRTLYPMYARSGDHPRALEHLEQLYQQEREILNAEVEQRVQELTSHFELERAQHQAELTRLRLVAAEEAREVAEEEVRERTRSLEQAQLEVVTRLAVAAEYRDDTTGEHTWRVGQMAAEIAARLGLPGETVELLRIAARLHDVGKIGIPDRILLKTGRLTDEEFRHMQQHTVIGSRILSGGRTRLLQMAEEIACAHHERWGGGGYPAGLSGEAIPLTARIVAVADVFDALTHNRPYKVAWSVGEALRELQQLSGTFFDPEVVEAALQVLPLPETARALSED
ncbi:tetratricopeptide repeat protein [Deinococcus phoenicis]|uniref:tetratricopeptide repeat protein n=1 Tax=Deinococcus phoenicis TaxID=1476583 RepID=UPI00126834E7|nr:tetratricopeptide repeat protein [Deinococcus phoenicis]